MGPGAFISYTHDDDRRDDGRIADLHKQLQREISIQLGVEFEVFFDRESIEWGARWAATIDRGIADASFFIPIVTPGYLRSGACRQELNAFLQHEREIGRRDLIFPLLYVEVPLADSGAGTGRDDLAHQLSMHQYVDWTDWRFVDPGSNDYRRAVKDLAVRISAIARTLEPPVEPMAPTPGSKPAKSRAGRGTRADDQSFDTFVAGPSNRFALAAAVAVAETPGRSYNPLFIYGDAGLGKTHLLQAIKHGVEENYPDYVVRYVTSETFLNQFIESIRLNTSAEFKRRYREVDVLLVDDIQFLENRKETQEEFFHTFNALHEGRRQLVLASDRPPDAISTLENHLRSRFKMGLITDIQPPDLETRLAILRTKAEVEPVPIPADVLEFIATNITDNIRELEGALNRVSALAKLNEEPLTLHEAERHLHDILGDLSPRPITPALILQATSERFGFTVEEITGKTRQRPLVVARQIAMYAFRELTDLSYPAIAREFGGRDHTTVIHAVEKVKELMKERREMYEQVTTLIQQIRRG